MLGRMEGRAAQNALCRLPQELKSKMNAGEPPRHRRAGGAPAPPGASPVPAGQQLVVIAVPTIFAEKRGAALLARNVRSALRSAGHAFESVARDGPLVVVNGAADPVLASAAVGMLSGIRTVGIARRAGARLADAAEAVAQVAGRLLLEGEAYMVRAEGRPRGYVPGDLEMAATSLIIERHARIGARPGTAARHDRELYAYATARHSYACLFADRGMGGVPAGTHPEPAACCMFDGLSAAACLEAIRQGYDVRMSVAYSTEADLRRLARAAGRLVPRTAASLLGGGPVEIEFFRIKGAAGGRAARLFTSCLLAARAAEKAGIGRAVLPVSPVVDAQGVIDAAAGELARRGMTAYAPLGALEDEIFANASAAGFEGFAREAARLAAASPAAGREGEAGEEARSKMLARAAEAAAAARAVRVSVRAGPSTVHDLLNAAIGGGNEDGEEKAGGAGGK